MPGADGYHHGDLRAELVRLGLEALDRPEEVADGVVARDLGAQSRVVGAELGQERAELTLEIMGNQGLGWEGEGFEEFELGAVRGWLGGKAFTIYGGSSEIQNNIIAKRMLGMLDHQ